MAITITKIRKTFANDECINIEMTGLDLVFDSNCVHVDTGCADILLPPPGHDPPRNRIAGE